MYAPTPPQRGTIEESTLQSREAHIEGMDPYEEDPYEEEGFRKHMEARREWLDPVEDEKNPQSHGCSNGKMEETHGISSPI